MRGLFSVLLLLSIAFSGVLSRADISSGGAPLPETRWSESERMAWSAIRSGRPFIGSDPDHQVEEPAAIPLRASFLESILLFSPWLDEIPHAGVRISHAVFTGDLNLENSRIGHHLALTDCRIDGPIRLSRLQAPYGISLAGIIATGPLDLSGAHIEGDLNLDRIRIGEFNPTGNSGPEGDENEAQKKLKDLQKGDIDLRGARIDGQISLGGAEVYGSSYLQGIQVASQMRGKNAFFGGDVRMQGAVIQKQLDLAGSNFRKSVWMQGLETNRRVNLEEAHISGRLDMKSAKIEGDVLFKEGCFLGDIGLITADVTGTLDLRKGYFQGKLEFFGLHVGDQMTLDGAVFTGPLQLQRINVDSTVSLRSVMVYGNLSMKAAKINGDLFLDQGDFHNEFDLHGVDIRGSVIFNQGYFEKPIQIDLATIQSVEYKGSRRLVGLNLNGTTVNKVFVRVPSDTDWPENLELHGFKYNLFVGEYENEEKDFYREWFHHMKNYSPQPFQQSASVLREAGYPVQADDVLYAGKEFEREQARKRSDWSRYAGLTLLKYTIGYGLGLRYFRCLYWVGLLLIIGTLVCRRACEGITCTIQVGRNGREEELRNPLMEDKAPILSCAFYSLDMLLPLIKLRGQHEKIDLPTPQRYYFYFHEICGWLLASFILAGLAGLTQQ